MKSLSSDPLSTVMISVQGMIVPFERLSPKRYIIIKFAQFTPRCQRLLLVAMSSLLDELVPVGWTEG